MSAEEVRQRAVQRKLDAARLVAGMRYVVTEGATWRYDVRCVASSLVMVTADTLHDAMEHASAFTKRMNDAEALEACK